MKENPNYPQKYEKFSDMGWRKLKIEKVSLYNNSPESLDEYIKLLHDGFTEMDRVSFDFIVKSMWLFRRFCYYGHRREKMATNNHVVDSAFSHFMRERAQVETKTYFGSYSSFLKIATYLTDFFPELDNGNPFTEKYEYPFKYMTLGCLTLVYKMDERLELLKHGDGQRMGYIDFLDYVLNYVGCYNEEHGKKYFLGNFKNSSAPFNIEKL